MWSLCSGALKKKENTNSNLETVNYYQSLVEKNKNPNKPLACADDIQKVICLYLSIDAIRPPRLF